MKDWFLELLSTHPSPLFEYINVQHFWNAGIEFQRTKALKT